MTPNRFAAPCAYCGEIVPAGEGEVSGKLQGPDKNWRVIHPACIPVSRSTLPNWDEVKRPWIIGLEYDL